jgi:DHA1 family multidrug resistance protein-like MFS transporter
MEATYWRKNLYVIAFAEFLAVAGFTIVNPFLPLYLQKFGSFTISEAAFWSGIAIGGGSIAMFLSAPIWGIVADRFGRKPMLLRSLLGGATIIGLYIVILNVYVFIGLRIIQGIFTGTVAAASAMLATVTPRDKIPFAMGVLMGAVYAGNSFGPLMGGFLADNLGFTITFMITSALLLTGGLLVLFLTREIFVPPAKEQRASLMSTLRLAISPELLPLLVVIVAINMGPQMISPIITLVISDINPGGDVASAAGLAFALTAIFASISSFVIGRINKRFSLKNILIFSCLVTGLLYLPPIWSNTVTQVIITVGLTGLLIGGAIISSSSLISFSVPNEQQGIAYGLSQSAAALGRGLGPITGGGLAPLIGLRPVFGVAAGIFVLIGSWSAILLFKRSSPVSKARSN